jgi:hypothetical protein
MDDVHVASRLEGLEATLETPLAYVAPGADDV